MGWTQCVVIRSYVRGYDFYVWGWQCFILDFWPRNDGCLTALWCRFRWWCSSARRKCPAVWSSTECGSRNSRATTTSKVTGTSWLSAPTPSRTSTGTSSSRKRSRMSRVVCLSAVPCTALESSHSEKSTNWNCSFELLCLQWCACTVDDDDARLPDLILQLKLTSERKLKLFDRRTEMGTADFAPGAATRRNSIKRHCFTFDWRRHRQANRQNTRVTLVYWPICSIIWKCDVIHQTGSTKHIAEPSEEDRATATGNTYRKSGEIWTCVFLRYSSGQTNKQTYRHADRNTLHAYRRRSNQIT